MGKGKLIAGIILIIVGVGLIPASFGMDNLLNRRMDESITTSMTSIRNAIRPTTDEIAYAKAVPETLLAFKNVAIPDVPGLVNGSVSSNEIVDVIVNLTGYIGLTNATEWFFNDPAWTVNTDSNYSIEGISQYSGLGNLSFTPLAISRTYNKLRENRVWGLGMNEYLSDYEDAIGDTPAQDAMANTYNSTWEQIQNVSVYLTDYLFPLVPTLGGFPYAATSTTAEDFFYMQWVNASLVPGSWDQIIGPGVEIESWEYKRTDLSLTQTQALWNEIDPSSPLNEDGILLWWESQENNVTELQLKTDFSSDDSQYDDLIIYFFNDDFKEDVIDPVYLELNGRTVSAFSLDLLYLHWANGETFENGVTEFNPLYIDFEVSTSPDTSDISADICRLLWTASTEHALRNTTGIKIWLEIARSADRTLHPDYIPLRNEFGLDDTQMEFLLDWTVAFRDSAVNILTEDQNLDYHPSNMVIFALTGTYIAAGLIGFIGLMFAVSSFKKQR